MTRLPGEGWACPSSFTLFLNLRAGAGLCCGVLFSGCVCTSENGGRFLSALCVLPYQFLRMAFCDIIHPFTIQYLAVFHILRVVQSISEHFVVFACFFFLSYGLAKYARLVLNLQLYSFLSLLSLVLQTYVSLARFQNIFVIPKRQLLYSPFLPLFPSPLSPHLSPRRSASCLCGSVCSEPSCKWNRITYCVAFFALHDVFKVYQGGCV